jgi:ribosome-binding ATPase YchF (GTP1/OBG family)
MKLSMGIVGLPNVGKSTLFKKLTAKDILIANYPFATIDPNVGIVTVPDDRLQALANLSNSKKTIPAVVEFYDIAGLVKGASVGEGLGSQFLSHIRDTQAIVMVVRIFPSSDIIHVEGSVDPVRDISIIETELALKDLETVEKRIKKAEGEARTGDKKAQKNLEILENLKTALSGGNLVTEYAGEEVVREMQLLTSKKQLFLFNGTESDLSEETLKSIEPYGGNYVVVDLNNEEETANGIKNLITEAYKTLGLISFFTTGEDETRAWTITSGDKAPKAAGVIHTDFENKFIRAEVVSCDDLLGAGGWNGAKQKGKIRLEGKEYEVKDGDVMVIRHG